MSDRRVFMRIRCIVLLLSLLCVMARPALASDSAPRIAGVPGDEALRLGEAMYLNGVLPSGKHMKAVVQGDIVVSGRMLTCSHCHMRGGLGSFEGNVLTLPTNGAKLYAPLASSQDMPGSGMARSMLKYPRPAYTDELLARVLRTGVDPAGRTIGEEMPRYFLDDGEMELLVNYLKNLSSTNSPGATGSVIRFATIVTEGVSANDREAMLEPLQAYIREEWNVVRPILSAVQRDNSYREVALDVWELKGPAAGWKDQLEALYRQQPVFALVGGLSRGPWSPVHEFCEKYKLPCMLPITDLPVISSSDWYTLYFSKGYYQEGETTAAYLSRMIELPVDKQIVQVYRDTEEAKALARGFTDVWKKLGKAPLKNRVLSAKEAVGREFWMDLASRDRSAVVLLWLEREDLAGIGVLADQREKPGMLFVSSTLIKDQFAALPDAIRDIAFVTYPRRLPGEQGQVASIVDQWLQAKKIKQKNPEIAAKVYFLTRALAMTLTNMRGNCYRDYFLDLLDEQEDRSAVVAAYPRISFGPGQRYASKGCYIITITKGAQPAVVRQSDWIIY